MITWNEVKQISSRLSLEIGAEDISCIAYRVDVFEYGSTVKIDRHVDIECSFGEYYEVREGTSLFQFICTVCNLPLLQEEQEMILYQK